MCPPHHILDRNKICRLAVEQLQTRLRFKGYKRKTTVNVLWAILLRGDRVGASESVGCNCTPRCYRSCVAADGS